MRLRMRMRPLRRRGSGPPPAPTDERKTDGDDTSAGQGDGKSAGQGEGKKRKFRLDWATAITQIVAVAALIIGIWQFEQTQQSNAAAALDQQRQDAISQYYDDMSTLVLQGKLTPAAQNAPELAIAEARTYTTLRFLDGARKADLIRYLWEAGLIMVPHPAINLRYADLRDVSFPTGTSLGDVDLSSLGLGGASLVYAQLMGADLSGSDLTGANLNLAQLTCLAAAGGSQVCANLSGATLTGADLVGANLTGADLRDATLTGADLNGAILQGATYNGRTLWPSGFQPRGTGAVCVGTGCSTGAGG
jgi:uncharacterized protein YjbI with pentapeptide repeats